jgi:hypothetical protein
MLAMTVREALTLSSTHSVHLRDLSQSACGSDVSMYMLVVRPG